MKTFWDKDFEIDTMQWCSNSGTQGVTTQVEDYPNIVKHSPHNIRIFLSCATTAAS